VDQRPSRIVRWLKRSQRGQALIEFAISAPVLVIMLLGLVEFGHGLNSYLTVVASARDAARFGAQQGYSPTTVTAMENVVAKQTERLSDSNTVTVEIDSCVTLAGDESACGQITGSSRKNKDLSVEVCYDHPTITGVALLPNPIHMCSTTTIRIATSDK
jgi:Flp pilus assembly protein TadG